MTSTLRRAAGFAAVGSLAFATPVLGIAAAVPFAVVAAVAAFVGEDGRLFELFACPGDRQDGRLTGLLGFALAAAALAVLATVPETRLPVSAFVAAVVVVAYGNLGEQLASRWNDGAFHAVAGFTVAGFLAAVGGQALVVSATNEALTVPKLTFLAAVGVFVAALLREVLLKHDDPLVLVSTGLLLWLFHELPIDVSPLEVAAALALTVVLGYVSYALGTASVAGMLTGILLGVLTIVLGGFGWFAVLITFFGVGALSTKFKYESKRRRGVAEENDGARGSGNVLGNAAVAMAAVLGYAATEQAGVELLFLFAFAGSLATAMSDTLSSEVGGLFDTPRLITTLREVEPGTDGAVTWQGELAGLLGAVLVAAVAALTLPLAPPLVGAVIVTLGGVGGMTVDSLLGATVEGNRVGNQAVNFLATLSGAVVSIALAALLLL
ncbi:DUF92 domain-containing protein [Haloprofundus halophilus]|uniref:DUF92 domain-containing protein n=1 Tax=Haloprofundus halophilus TaxID=2283527 RepID=UPI000E4392EE|nr:DUF92 domain-containing protein [Haloprofundus halophilus]